MIPIPSGVRVWLALGHRVHDTDRIRVPMRERGAFANIPANSNRRSKPLLHHLALLLKDSSQEP